MAAMVRIPISYAPASRRLNGGEGSSISDGCLFCAVLSRWPLTLRVRCRLAQFWEFFTHRLLKELAHLSMRRNERTHHRVFLDAKLYLLSKSVHLRLTKLL